MSEMHDDSDSSMEHLGPLLDEAISLLGAANRTAVILQFFEQRDLRYISEVLGTNKNTARMRMTRALEKLQSLFKRRGVTFSGTALGALLASEAVKAAPAGFALAASSAALGSAALGTGVTLTMTKLKLTLVAASVTIPLVVQHQSQVKLRRENLALQTQVNRLAGLAAENQRLSNRLARAQSLPFLRLPTPPMPSPPSAGGSSGGLAPDQSHRPAAQR